MARVPESECGIGVAKATLASFQAADIAQAEDLLRFVFDAGQQQGVGMVTRAEAASIATETIMRTVREPLEKEMTSVWTTKTNLQAAAKEGTKGKPRDVRNLSLMHQHRLLKGHVSILGMTRRFFEKSKAFGKGEPFKLGAAVELTTRLNLHDGFIRAAGIPPVTMNPGGTHVSHLTVGDIFKVLLAPGITRGDEVVEGFLRTDNAEANIPFQNLAEAVRRIIEHNDNRLPFAGEDLEKIKGDVLDALVNAMGKPVDSAAAAAMERTRKWLMGDEGRIIVGKVANALTEPKVIEKLIEENARLFQLSLVMQRADGIRITQQTLDQLAGSPWAGEQIEGMGALLFEDGIKKIFGDDFMVKLSPDGVNLTFAEQFLAKVAASLSPENLAHIRQVHSNIKASRLDAAASRKSKKPVNTNKNKARKQTSDEIAENAQKSAEDAVQNDPNVKVNEPTAEAAVIADTFYKELKYGSVVGGLAKILSKVSDPIFMSPKGKTMMVGIEHVRLESAGTMMAGLRVLNDSVNGDAVRVNKVFNTIARNLGGERTPADIDNVIRMLDPEDQVFGADLIKYIDAMFGVGANNAIMQNGIFVEELARSLQAVGLRDQADLLRAQPLQADELLDYWKNIKPAEGENALDIMGRYYSAQQISMIPPSMADSLARHFSHTAEGLDAKEAIRQGWFALDEGSTLGKYMTYGKQQVLFPPEFRGRIKAIEEYLDFDRSIGTGKMADIIRKIDQITSVLKSSITIWRPGHHMVSMVGNIFMNTLAGVAPYDYGIAIKLLTNRTDVVDADIPAINELMRLSAPSGTQLKGELLDKVRVPITQGGKTSYVNLDIATINLAMERTGAYINPRRVRDIVTTDDLGSGAFSATRKLTNNPLTRGVESVDHQIARFAALRDNVARAALFVKELRKMKPMASLDDAFLEAARRVHEFHPTVGTLTAPERKVARRLFYFYTWQKQAFFKILEVTANKPALVTVPSKLQFAIATAQGLDPQSFGNPYSAHGWFASYNSASLYGPQWDDEQYGLMGIKPPIPQLDVIDSYLSGIRVKPEDGLFQNIGNLASSAWQEIIVAQASPALRIPAELSIGARVTTGQKIETGLGLRQYGEYLIDNTGLGSLSRIYDWTPWGPRSDTDLNPYADWNRQRQWWNYLAGMKITAYESPASLRIARQEAIDYYQKLYQTGKYAPKMSLQEYQQLQEGN